MASSLLEQLRTVVDKGAAAERELYHIGESTTQTAQLAYSLNCIWLYAQTTTPTREVLSAALPPVPDGTPETTVRTLEYIRRTLIIIRSLVSEKIEEAFRANTDLQAFQTLLGEAIAQPNPPPAIGQLEEAEVEEIVQDFVPSVIRPLVQEKQETRKGKKQRRPWMLT